MTQTLLQISRSQSLKIFLAFAAIYLIWGTTYLAIRVAVETIPPFMMAGYRFLIAGIITFAVLRARGVPAPSRGQVRSASIVGALLLVGGNGLVTWSEKLVPSSIAALVVATVPLWITLLDWLVYRGKQPGRLIMIGLVVGFAGTGLLFGAGNLHETLIPQRLLILLLAPILWSIGSLHARRLDLPDNTFMSTSVEMLAGGAMLLGLGLLTGEQKHLQLAAISKGSLVSMLYLVLFGSIVALSAYAWLLKTVHVHKVSTYTYVNPVIAVLLGWQVLGESVTPQMLLAIVVIIFAVVLITSQKGSRGPQSIVSSPVVDGDQLPIKPRARRT